MVENNRRLKTGRLSWRSTTCLDNYSVLSLGKLCWIFLVFIASCSSRQVDKNALFYKMSNEKTNINFINRLEYQPDFNILDYLYFYDGGGVAVGDINNDGFPDLYFTANMGQNKLYLNKGDFSFADISQRANVAGDEKGWSTGVTMADVNGDGWLDIYVCNVNHRSRKGHNKLYINNGDSTFTEKSEEYGLDFKGLSTQAAFFDYDRDSDLDMYLLNHSVHSNRSYGSASKRKDKNKKAGDRLYRNDGANFTDVTNKAGIYSSALGYGLGVAISDLNQDGWLDIYIGNDFHENDYLYFNDGDGTFSEKLQHSVGHTSQASMGNDVADINNDKRPDILSLDMRPEKRTMLKHSGGEDSERVSNIKRKLGYAPQISRNTLQLNRGYDRNGYPKFSEIGAYAGIEATDWSWASLFADLNNDGWKDLFVTNGMVRRPNDLDYIRYVSSPQIQEKLKRSSPEVEREVIRNMPSLKISNYAYRNNGNLTFSNKAKEWGLSDASFSNGAAYGDLDIDGDLDLVVNNINSRAFIYKNRSDSLFDRHFLNVKLKGDKHNTSGIGAKIVLVNGEQTIYQEQIPTRGFQSSVTHVIHFGLGKDINHVDTVKVYWPDGRYQMLKDVAVDQSLTIWQKNTQRYQPYKRNEASKPIFQEVTSDYNIEYRHKENIYSDFKRQYLIPHKISTEGPALTVGDVNGDNRDDFYVGGARGQAGKLFIQTTEGNFIAGDNRIFRLDWGRENVDAAFADFDGDSDQDLYVVNGGGGEFSVRDEELQDRLYLNNGNGVFSIAKNHLPKMYGDGATVSTIDYDLDGDMDLFVGNHSIPRQYGKSPRSFLLENNGRGFFKDVTHKVAPGIRTTGMVTDSKWADITGDSIPDLVIVGKWMPITLWKNTTKGLENITQDFGLQQTNGWWNNILVADLDDDGDQDIAAGNLGQNSVFEPSFDYPLKLYLSDFDDNGSYDPILAEYDNGEYYPRARLNELLRQFPNLKNKIKSYKTFANMGIVDLFGAAKIKKAIVKKVYTFETSYFENRNQKKFIAHSLPRQVQFTPIQAMLAGDFDSDGKKDLLVKGNFLGSDSDQGRYDAGYGVLLKGNGKGYFEAVPPSQSGITVSGEGRAIKKVNAKNKNSLIMIALNDTTLQFFKSTINQE